MINLCLDTNVYLSFYHFSDNSLEKLEDMVKLIDNEELNILLPEQIENEFFRNRENKIKDAIKTIKDFKIEFKLPRIGDAYNEKKDLGNIFKEYTAKKDELINKIEKDTEKFTLKADILIKNIFENSEKILLTDDIWTKAKKRFDLGNPPGKDKSYGDSVIRESLLNYKDGKLDIYFVSNDGDFSCNLNPRNLDNFLKKERDKKITSLSKGEIYYFNNLNDFFEANFPNIKINEEYFKNKNIENLEESYSFDRTRKILLRLINSENLSLDQVNRIIDASISNCQIYWAKDYTPRVSNELVKLIKPYLDKINFSKVMDFLKIYDPQEYKRIEDIYESKRYEQNKNEEDF